MNRKTKKIYVFSSKTRTCTDDTYITAYALYVYNVCKSTQTSQVLPASSVASPGLVVGPN